jgi:hypothetical protein
MSPEFGGLQGVETGIILRHKAVEGSCRDSSSFRRRIQNDRQGKEVQEKFS